MTSVGINGLGRIGRLLTRRLFERHDARAALRLTMCNEVADAATVAQVSLVEEQVRMIGLIKPLLPGEGAIAAHAANAMTWPSMLGWPPVVLPPPSLSEHDSSARSVGEMRSCRCRARIAVGYMSGVSILSSPSVIWTAPCTCSASVGLCVPMPTLPSAAVSVLSMLSEGAVVLS